MNVISEATRCYRFIFIDSTELVETVFAIEEDAQLTILLAPPIKSSIQLH
jgi:hypothetical protein